MTNISNAIDRPRAASPLVLTLFTGLAFAVIGSLLSGGRTVTAQTQNPCGLLTSDEIHALAPNEQLGDPVSTAIPSLDFSTCRYSWGSGAGRSTLSISVNSASRMFTGMSSDSVKRALVSSIAPGTTDATIPDIGDAAVFRAYSPIYAGASVYLKDRVLQVTLDGFDAREMKDQLIALLKSAASRL